MQKEHANPVSFFIKIVFIFTLNPPVLCREGKQAKCSLYFLN